MSFKIKFDGKKLIPVNNETVNEHPKPSNSSSKKLFHANVDVSGNVKITSDISIANDEFNAFIKNFSDDIIKMDLAQGITNTIFTLSENLVKESFSLCLSNIGAKVKDSELKKMVSECISTTINQVYNQIHKFNTQHKRNKQQNIDKMYVAPEEKSIGSKWRTKIDGQKIIPAHSIVQPTFQFISIVKTLQSLFLHPDFKKIYFDYNETQKHECIPGVYKDYCCGSRFIENGLHLQKNAVHIQLSIDDVELCCGLKTKAGVHKVTAIYFKILNLPKQFSSKLEQIFLVAICETANINAVNGLNHIVNSIVKELNFLSEHGIDIDGQIIKGFLINVCFDNLGGNQLYGLKENFASDFYCRICEMTLDECKQNVCENPTRLRTIDSYEHIMKIIKENSNVNFQITKGFADFCPLNDVKYFHILKNLSADAMHDVMEGVEVFFIEHFVNYCHANYLSMPQIANRVRDFNYGVLNKRNRPSLLKEKKANLGQNATQMHCLALHLPFIFSDLRLELPDDIKKAMSTLLRIMQIIFSPEVLETDVETLKLLIKEHLEHYMKAFGTHLRAKHHNLIHYPNIIRIMGPIIRMIMLRYEAKHKVLTNMAKRTNNFVNIAMSLAERHQKISYRSNCFKTDISKSKSMKFCNSDNFERFEPMLVKCGPSLKFDFVVNELDVFKFVNFDSFECRPGLFVIENYDVFEILEIFAEGDKFFVLCLLYEIILFDEFFNSIEIKPKLFVQDNIKIITIADLQNKQTYRKIVSSKKFYIIADTLNVYRDRSTNTCC